MAVAGKEVMAICFPEDLSGYAVRLTCYSIILAILTIAKTSNRDLIKSVSGLGIGLSSTTAVLALRKNQDDDAIVQLETDAKMALAADRITALETIEAERIREHLTVELHNSQTRLSEWE